MNTIPRIAVALVGLLALLAIPRLASAQVPLPTLAPADRARIAVAAEDQQLPAWQRDLMRQLADGATSTLQAPRLPEADELASDAGLATTVDGYWSKLDPISGREGASIIFDPVRDRLIVFGGGGADVWQLPLSGPAVWSQLLPTGTPPVKRTGQSAIYDPVRDRMVVFGGRDGSLHYHDVWALSLSGVPAWTELQPNSVLPDGRYGHSAIYDPVRDRMVVFGGYAFFLGSAVDDEVWALSLSGAPVWTQQFVSFPIPSARAFHVAVYDPVRDRMVVHGGEGSTGRLGDVWAMPLASAPAWTELAPAGTPPSARSAHGAVYDPVGDRMVIFGGSYYGTDLKQDVWSLSLGGTPEWAELLPTGAPGVRAGQATTFDATRGALVVFGGATPSVVANDVWTLALADPPAWTERSPVMAAPGSRTSFSAVLDPVGERVIVFGGYNLGYLGDLWALSLTDAKTWSLLTPTGTPPGPRALHSAMYDPVRQRMIVFGGSTGAYLDELWSLSLDGELVWTQLTPGGTPPTARRAHTAIYDAVRDRMLVFGGLSAGGRLADVWALSLADPPAWSALVPTGTPPSGRFAHTATLDPVRDRMIVFGGYDGANRNDTWAFSLADPPVWSALLPDGALPLARRSHAAVYEPLRDRMVVSWGLGTVPYGDIWALSLSGTPTWSVLLPFYGPPTARYSHVALADDARGRMITLFGGTSSNTFSDCWALNWGTSLGVEPALRPTALGLSAPAPNPFRGSTALSFALPRAGRVTLAIHDLSGRLVRRLVDGERAAGTHVERWDGTGASSVRLGAGVYFAQLAGPGVRGTRRVVLLR